MMVRAWVGIVLLALGVFGLLDAAGVLDAGMTIGRWWPLAVIGLGVAAMVAQRRMSVGPMVVTVVGVVLLASRQDWLVPALIAPLVLVAVGVAVMVGVAHTGLRRGDGPVFAVLGGSTTVNRAEHLRHADVSAVFGGATLDLRQAHIDDRATVDAFALFGGVDVLVPKGWRVSVSGLPIFGGYDDKTVEQIDLPEDAPVLTVNATAVFGGVGVANEPH
jgi:Cell wall-active antibiotics response 4TMS YvqF